MSLAQLFYAKQAFRRAMQWARHWRKQRRYAHAPRSFQLEALEPRLLMSADQTMLPTVSLTRVADSQLAAVEGAQFPPGAFNATAGSRLHESFTSTGEVDAFYFDAVASQHMALELIAHTPAIQGRVEILDPTGASIGSVDAGSAGGYVLLQDKVLAQTGRYTIEFESLNGTGTYDGNVFVGTTSLPTVAATTNNWINAAGGNWSAASNWSRGVAPTATDIVGITLDGTYTVTMDVSTNVAGLVFGGTTGTQSLTINSTTLTLNGLSQVGTHGTFNLNGGTLTGTGEIDISGRLNWKGGTMGGTGLTLLTSGATFAYAPTAGSTTLSRVLENQTNATWTSGNLNMSGGTFLNKGTVTASTNGTLFSQGFGGTNQFLNQGAFIKQGTGTVQFTVSSTNVAFNNSGVVDVQGGSLALSAGGTHSADFTLAAGTSLLLSGTQTFSNTSDVTGTAATVNVQGGTASFGGEVRAGAVVSSGTTSFGPVLETPNLTVTSGTTTINTALALTQLNLSNGTLTGSGNLTVSGAFVWKGGTMGGTGLTLLTSGATFAYAPTAGSTTLSRVLENQTNATWTSGNLNMSGGTFLNKGTVTANTTGTLFSLGLSGGPNQFLNQGAFVKQGTGTVQFTVSSTNIAFNNDITGTVDIQAGTLSLATSGTHTGDFTLSANAVLDLSGTHTFGATSDVTGTTTSSTGIVQVSGGTSTFGGTLTPGTLVLINSGIATVNVASQVTSLLVTSSSILNGSGTVTATGASTWSGGTMSGTGRTIIGSTGTLALTGATNTMTLSRLVENQGTATWSGGSISNTNGNLLNTGTFVATSAGTLSFFGGPGGTNNPFTNQGTFRKQGAGTTQFFTSSSGVIFDNSGIVEVQTGTLSLAVASGTHTGDFTVATGTTLQLDGTHTFQSTSDITGAGTLQIVNGTSIFGGTLTPGELIISGGTATINSATTLPKLTFNNGTLNGTGDLTLTGASTWVFGTMSGTGRTIIGPTGTMLIDINTARTVSRVLENQGAVTWSAGNIEITNGQLLNTGTFIANAGGTLQSYGGPGGTNNRFTNQGIFRKQGGGAANFFTSSSNIRFENQGTIDVQAGTLSLLSTGLTNFSRTTLTGGTYQISGTGVLQFTGANIVTNAANIILSGTATNPIVNESNANGLTNFATNAATGSFSLQGSRDFTRTGNFTNNGAMSLGPGSIFTVTGGSYTQPATGVLTVQINGLNSTTNIGRLVVSGNASLNGTLNIQLTDGYVPVIGDTFKILTFGSLTGDFPNVNGLDFRPGLRFLRGITPTGMTLTVVEDGNFPGPTVTSSSPAEGGVVSPGTVTYQATFSEPMATANLGAEDVILRDKITNGTYTPATFNYDTLTNRVTVAYSNIPESDYEIRLISSDTAFRGTSGGRLDGDGDGREGGDYLVNFLVDTGTRAFNGTFQNVKPLGSIVRESTPVSGRFHATDDSMRRTMLTSTI